METNPNEITFKEAKLIDFSLAMLQRYIKNGGRDGNVMMFLSLVGLSPLYEKPVFGSVGRYLKTITTEHGMVETQEMYEALEKIIRAHAGEDKVQPIMRQIFGPETVDGVNRSRREKRTASH